VLGGGLGGLAEMIEISGISFMEVFFNGLLWVIVAFLGVGYAIRRRLPDTLARLGLRAPTVADWRAGGSFALLLTAFQICAGSLWVLLAPPEQLAEQTAASQAIGMAIDTLPLALAVSVFAAFGEEIFFRGALQPVFGLVPTALFFTFVHLQYTLTPASVLIIVVALALGWVRQRYSTTAAIIAHFLYNFIPLSLSLLMRAAGQ
jgi:uncharacterized protein